MYIKKKQKKSPINILISLIVLFGFSYIIITADRYNVEIKNYTANAAFFEIKERQNKWMIPLWEIVVTGEEFQKFTYTVQKWDNLTKIANLFWTTVDNVKSLNSLKSDVIKPWDKLLISDEEWIIYEIKESSKLIDFTSKYWIDIDKIKELNYYSDNNVVLEKWDEIFLPIDNEKAMEIWLIEKPVKSNPKNNTTYSNPTYTYSWKSIVSKYYYKPSIYNWFYQWHCTWYVAIKKFPYISETKQKKLWNWNAKNWYRNAKNAWYSVWKTPQKWAIVVLKYWGTRYYYYGHVWIVEDIDWKNNKILIDEMNAVWRFVVSKRWIPMDSKVVWYIYM